MDDAHWHCDFQAQAFATHMSEPLEEVEDEDIFNVTNRFRGPPLDKIYAVG